MIAVRLSTSAVDRRWGHALARSLVAAVFAPIVTVSLLAQPRVAPVQANELTRRATDRLRSLHEEADALAADERSILAELRRLELERQIRSEEVLRAEEEVSVAAEQIASTDAQIARFVTDRDAERPWLRARLVEIYKLGQGRYFRLLLSTTDLRDLGRAARTVAALARRDRERIAGYERRLGELSAARQAQSSRQQLRAVQRGAAAQAQAAAARAVAARNAMVRAIDQKRDLNARLVSELQAAHQKLQSTIRGAALTGTGLSLPIGPFRGVLPWPATGAVQRRGALVTSAEATTRAGIEIEAPEGSAVRAVHDGTVAYAGSFEGLGNLVILDHGAQSFSLYGHLLEMAVGRGAHVDRSQTVGRVGSPPTGSPALYFELRIDGHPVDALQWLGSNGQR